MTKKDIFNLIKNYRLDIAQRDFDYRFRILHYLHKVDESYEFTEIGEGVSLKNINFYLSHFKKANIPKSEYSVYKCYSVKRYPKKQFFVNAISYTRNCIPIIKNCIYKLDMFKAVVMGVVSAENRIEELEKYKTVLQEEKERIIDHSVREKLKNRRKMWQEIEEGVNRFLEGERFCRGGNPTIFNNEDFLNQGIHEYQEGFLMFHGDQFRRWVRNNICWKFSTKPKLIQLGHFHMMFPMIKGTTLVIFNGHFVGQYQTKFSKYYFSHLGASTLTTDFKEVKNIMFLRLA